MQEPGHGAFFSNAAEVGMKHSQDFQIWVSEYCATLDLEIKVPPH